MTFSAFHRVRIHPVAVCSLSRIRVNMRVQGGAGQHVGTMKKTFARGFRRIAPDFSFSPGVCYAK
jgi:hypothetical protein